MATTDVATPKTLREQPIPAVIPPLENGDHLTREEFDRRWDAMPHLKHAERIEGVVYMPAAAVRFEHHGGPHLDMMTWLGVYYAATPGTEAGDNSTIRIDPENDPQPDAFLRIAPNYGGQSNLDQGGYVTGAPELVAEIAAASSSYDLYEKQEVYRRNRVREYIVWKVLDWEVVWFVLRDGQYAPHKPDDRGVFKSEQFPGLWLDAQSLLRGDLAQVLAVLQSGISSAEHAAFIKQLQANSKSSGD